MYCTVRDMVVMQWCRSVYTSMHTLLVIPRWRVVVVFATSDRALCHSISNCYAFNVAMLVLALENFSLERMLYIWKWRATFHYMVVHTCHHHHVQGNRMSWDSWVISIACWGVCIVYYRTT